MSGGLLALKLTLTPVFVAGASLAGRRFGPRVGGMAVALPVVGGPILFFFALEQGPAFAASAAAISLLGLSSLALCYVAYAHAARSLARLGRAAAAALCLPAGWAVFMGCAALLKPLHPSAGLCLAAGVAAVALGRRLIPDVPADRLGRAAHHPAAETGLRMAAAGGMVVALTGLAASLGASWSGLLTPFPVASSVVVAGTHLSDGPQALADTLRGFLQGLYGFVAFLAVIAFGLQPLGLAAAFTLGVLASVAVQAALLWRRGRI